MRLAHRTTQLHKHAVRSAATRRRGTGLWKFWPNSLARLSTLIDSPQSPCCLTARTHAHSKRRASRPPSSCIQRGPHPYPSPPPLRPLAIRLVGATWRDASGALTRTHQAAWPERSDEAISCSSTSSAAVASILPREKSSIASPSTMVHLPAEHVTGKE